MSTKSFYKKPGEQYILSVEFVNSLPTGTNLESATISAVDDSGTDISSTVLDTTVGTISGTKVLLYVKNGTSGTRAHIKVRVELDDNFTKLEENLLMNVEENS